MTFHRTHMPWCLVAVALLFACGMNPAMAKNDCNCTYGTVIVSPVVACKFKICFETVGSTTCTVLGPGSAVKFDCNDQVAISLIDCEGNAVYLTDGCAVNVPVGRGCCVEACLGRDDNGCLLLKIGPSPLDFCPC